MPTSPIWRDFMVNADYVWITGDAFTDMRLLVEGAIVLYERMLATSCAYCEANRIRKCAMQSTPLALRSTICANTSKSWKWHIADRWRVKWLRQKKQLVSMTVPKSQKRAENLSKV